MMKKMLFVLAVSLIAIPTFAQDDGGGGRRSFRRRRREPGFHKNRRRKSNGTGEGVPSVESQHFAFRRSGEGAATASRGRFPANSRSQRPRRSSTGRRSRRRTTGRRWWRAPRRPRTGRGSNSLAALQGGPAADELKKINDDLMSKITAALKPEQQAAFKKYLNGEIKKQGGFGALKVTMEEAGAPLTAEQEPQIQGFYNDDTQLRAQLRRESQGNPDPAKLADIDKVTMGKVAKVLTAAQRKALLDSRAKPQ